MVFLGSCDQKASKAADTPVAEEKVEKNISHLQVDISGMTCEIGCARLIQSKLYKADGVQFARVSFEDSTGVLTYDANRISPEEIQKVIEAAGGGDLYTVRDMRQIQELPALDESGEASQEASQEASKEVSDDASNGKSAIAD